MKIRVFKLMAIILLIQCIKYAFFMEYKEDYSKGRIEVSFKNETIDYKLLKQLDGYKKLSPIPISKIEGNVMANGTGNSVNVLGIVTDYIFYANEGIHLQQGSFFGPNFDEYEKNLAVISNELAMQLFGTENVVGNICKINEHYYQIIGVYVKRPNLWEKYFDDGKERVYISFNSSLAVDVPIQHLIIQDRSKSELGQLNITEHNSVINDKSEGAKVLQTYNQVPIAVLGIFIMGWIGKRVVGGVKEYAKVYQREYEKSYAIETVKRTLVQFIQTIVRIGGGIILIYLVFKISFSTIYVLPEALPSDNIFDLSFYYRYLMDQNQRYSYFLQENISIFNRRHTALVRLSTLLGVIQIFCCYSIAKLLSSKQPLYAIFKFLKKM